MRRLRASNGFTLLEMVVALAVWLILVLSVSQYLLYTARTSTRLILQQEAFENARAAMDGLTVNLQMAETIKLEIDARGMLKKLTLTEVNPNGQLGNYEFYYKSNALPGEAKYHRLEFGQNDEFASYLSEVHLAYTSPGYITITIVTDESISPSITLNGMVDVRYKTITVIQN